MWVLDNTSGTMDGIYRSYQFIIAIHFTIDYSLLYGGASATAGVIQYFVVAQILQQPPTLPLMQELFAAPRPVFP